MITIDNKYLAKASEMLKNIPGGVQKAARVTINKAINSAKSDAAKQVSRKYVVTQAYVRQRLGQPRLATFNNLTASIASTGNTRNLTSFKMNMDDVPRGRGARTLERNRIKVAVKKGGRVKPIKRHFLIRSRKNDALLIVARKGREQKASKPLVARRGPSIEQMLGSKEVVKEIEAKAQGRIEKNINHEINRLLKGYGK